MSTFEIKIARILEVESVQATDSLENCSAWDSLAILSTLAMVDSDYGVTLNGQEVARSKTIGDVWNLIDSARHSRIEPG